MKTVIEKNTCSLCPCGMTSITVSAIDDDGDGFGLRVLGGAKISRTVKRYEDYSDPMVKKSLVALDRMRRNHGDSVVELVTHMPDDMWLAYVDYID